MPKDVGDKLKNPVISVAMTLIRDIAIKALVKRILIAVPFFANPILGPIITYVVTKVSEKFFTELYYHGIIMSVNFKVDSEVKNYKKAVSKFKQVTNNPMESEENKQKAIDEFKKSLSDLIDMR